jgi:hypothetical protein
MNSDPESFWIKTKNLSHKFPRPRDGVFLEVITKTKVAQHLEKHKVAFCAAHIVEVVVLSSSSDALLDSDSPVVRSDFVTHEVGLEGHHSGHSEEQRGVMRNEAGRRDDRMRSVTKEL